MRKKRPRLAVIKTQLIRLILAQNQLLLRLNLLPLQPMRKKRPRLVEIKIRAIRKL
jgi:hypothetical protein